jgi:hypothetical protein
LIPLKTTYGRLKVIQVPICHSNAAIGRRRRFWRDKTTIDAICRDFGTVTGGRTLPAFVGGQVRDAVEFAKWDISEKNGCWRIHPKIEIPVFVPKQNVRVLLRDPVVSALWQRK